MIIIAATLYLPQHITFLTNRAWFYYNGDESTKAVQSVDGSTGASMVLVEKIKETILGAGTSSPAMEVGKEL
jgi:hypothetical protein